MLKTKQVINICYEKFEIKISGSFFLYKKKKLISLLVKKLVNCVNDFYLENCENCVPIKAILAQN